MRERHIYICRITIKTKRISAWPDKIIWDQVPGTWWLPIFWVLEIVILAM